MGPSEGMVSADYEHIGVGFAEANGFSWYILMAGWVADGESAAGSGAAVAGLPATPAPAVLPAAPVMLSEPGEDGAIYHEVQSGQAAWTIAARYGLTVEELYALNDLTDSWVIHSGDQLLIRPADTPKPTATTPPTATSPAPTVTNTPIVAKTLTAPPEIAAAFSSPTPVATAATAGIDQTPTGGSTQLAVALIVGAGVALLLLLYFVARAKRRS